jgi:peptidoglycan/xylan/chitin deacetylase (PgdA/CDA1 family)
VWKISTLNPEIYLTFDDGPIPQLTEYVLETLAQYDAKATFFCVGENIFKYPQICRKVVNGGHIIGNHTFNHVNGWSIKNEEYFLNIEKCQSFINQFQDPVDKPLLRPPYGKISKDQIHKLKEVYQIIMWDILTYDFDNSHSSQKSLKRIITASRPGSIVVFHDNYKAEKKLKFMLPRFLEHFKGKGYDFKKLDPTQMHSSVNQ